MEYARPILWGVCACVFYSYTPLCDAARVCPFDAILHLFVFEASAGMLDWATTAHIAAHGFFADLLDKLQTPAGVDMLATSLTASPDGTMRSTTVPT